MSPEIFCAPFARLFHVPFWVPMPLLQLQAGSAPPWPSVPMQQSVPSSDICYPFQCYSHPFLCNKASLPMLYTVPSNAKPSLCYEAVPSNAIAVPSNAVQERGHSGMQWFKNWVELNTVVSFGGREWLMVERNRSMQARRYFCAHASYIYDCLVANVWRIHWRSKKLIQGKLIVFFSVLSSQKARIFLLVLGQLNFQLAYPVILNSCSL